MVPISVWNCDNSILHNIVIIVIVILGEPQSLYFLLQFRSPRLVDKRGFSQESSTNMLPPLQVWNKKETKNEVNPKDKSYNYVIFWQL